MKGQIWIVGDSIDTDLIVPSHVLTESDPKKQILAVFETIIPYFAQNVRQGDIIVGGKNFGCGSSREEAVFVLKTLGITTIIAKSFARIFYRNAINLGLIPLIIPNLEIFNDHHSSIGDLGDIIMIDILKGVISNVSHNLQIQFKPFPRKLYEIVHAGGAINSLQKAQHIK
jgi:3-isopropylmalate/(R)-2-methylmalate dehydratase small subunit